MSTTHPDSPHVGGPDWAEELRTFCERTSFSGLRIVEAPDAIGDVGTVTFHATLSQGAADASFTEVSRFERVDGRWLYLSGVPETSTSR